MRWAKRHLWKTGIAVAAALLLLGLSVWLLVFVMLAPASADAYSGTVGHAIAGTAQATPTPDATMAALQKEQLTQQVRQLDNWWLYWLYNGSTAFIAAFASVIIALFGIYQWAGNRRNDLRAQAEERFKAAVTALGSENEATRVGGAILLRSFLNIELHE